MKVASLVRLEGYLVSEVGDQHAFLCVLSRTYNVEMQAKY